jgi:hypothetical protein
MAHDVRALYSKVAHQRPTVQRLLCEANRTRRPAAPGTADAMVVQHSIASGERWLFNERREEVRKDAGVNEYDWLTASKLLILELDAINSCPSHLLCHDVSPWRCVRQSRLTSRVQPRRLVIPPADVGCNSC